MELYCEMDNLLFEKYYRGNLRRARYRWQVTLLAQAHNWKQRLEGVVSSEIFWDCNQRCPFGNWFCTAKKWIWLVVSSTIPPSYGDSEAGSILSVLDQRIILMNKYSKYNNVTPILKNIRSNQLDKRGLPMAGDDGWAVTHVAYQKKSETSKFTDNFVILFYDVQTGVFW